MKYTIKDGVEITINKDSFNDMRVIDCLCELEEGNVIAVSKLLNLILSKEDKQKMYDSIKDESGRISVDKFAPLFQSLMESLNDKDIKN